MARQQWATLSDAYRKRLTRGGITEQQYESGANLAGARGHKTATKENERRRFLRSKRRYAEKLADTLERDYDDVYEEIDLLTDANVEKLIDYQARLQKMFQSGRRREATLAFQEWSDELMVPWWMIAYRGEVI